VTFLTTTQVVPDNSIDIANRSNGSYYRQIRKSYEISSWNPVFLIQVIFIQCQPANIKETQIAQYFL